MKIKKVAFIVMSLMFLTGCYPTGKNTIYTEINYNNELNESPRDNLIYNFILPEDYVRTYNVSKAVLDNFDYNLAEEFFPDCKENLVNTIEDDERNYYLYQKENSWVNFWNGTITMWSKVGNNYVIIDSLLRTPKSHIQIQNEFPRQELKGVSSENMINRINNILDRAEIERTNPSVFAFTKEEEKYINDMYGYKNLLDDDIYIIKYPSILGGLPVADYSYSQMSSDTQWIPLESEIMAVFNENENLEFFDCRNMLKVLENCEPIQICSPEQAVQQIKNFIENTTLSGTMYGCELNALVYFPQGYEPTEYSVRPVWSFGWKPENEQSSLLYVYYVDAETGYIY